MFRSSFFGLAAVMLLAACSGDRNPMSPRTQQPALGISDGAHSGGNRDFFFMPPMAANPSGNQYFEAGRFNALLQPSVVICRLDIGGTACDLDVKTFAGSAISVGDEKYQVNWHTDESDLETSRLYRIEVFVGATSVGYLDVDPVSTGKELRSINTNEYIGLVDGKTLPIKFRIEQGVTCENRGDCAEQTVSNSGGTVVTNTEHAGVRFPTDWLPVNPRTGKPYENVTVKIERIPVGIDNRCHSDLQLLQFEGCYSFTTDPYVGTFAKPVVAGICPELSPSDPLYSSLAFYKSGEGEETAEAPEAAAPFVDCEGFEGTPLAVGGFGRISRELYAFAGHVGTFLSPKPAYAIDVGVGGELFEFTRGGYAIEAHMEMMDGDGQTAAPGETLESEISVQVLGHHDRPVRGFPVTFTTSAGSVDAEGAVYTNADGVASVSWTLGNSSGQQSVTASGPTGSDPIVFTATAEQVIAAVNLAARRLDFGLGQLSAQVNMTQYDASENPITPLQPCTWSVTSVLSNISIDQNGIVSATRPDDGVVTANCDGVVGTAAVEAGDFQFTASGSVSDPIGDTGEGGFPGEPDLIGLSASVADRKITLTIDYHLASLTDVSVFSAVSIDTDQSFATGHPGLSSSGTLDNTIIGVDYLFWVDGGVGTLLRYNGTPNSFSTVLSSVSCVTMEVGGVMRRYSCTIPLSKLDYDDGYVNFKATASANYPTGGNNGIRDQITNAGQAPGTTSPVIF